METIRSFVKPSLIFNTPNFYPQGAAPMTANTRVIQTLRNETIDRLPRSFAVSPENAADQWDVAQELFQRYPTDIMILGGRAENRGYCNLIQNKIDLPEKDFTDAINQICGNSLFKIGIIEFSPWVEMLKLLESDTDEEFDDLLDRFEAQLKPWVRSDLDALCLYDPLSVNGEWDKQALNNMNDLTLFYEIFIETLHEKDKFAFLDFGGRIFEIMPAILKLSPDAVACTLTPELAVALSDFTAAFKAMSEQTDGRRLTFWADIPTAASENKSWADVKTYVQNILTELNQGNKGIIARSVWRPGQKTTTAGFETQAWEQGLPPPPPVVSVPLVSSEPCAASNEQLNTAN